MAPGCRVLPRWLHLPHASEPACDPLQERNPTLDEVAQACRPIGIAVAPPELHGALCGWLAGGGVDSADWLASVMADESMPAETAGGALAQLRKATSAQMAGRELDLELLLAGDDRSLAERSGSLFSWCRGFLGGFGLAAGKNPPLSEESKEALADIAKFAAATPQEDGDEEDEAAMVELEEFVRVAALLIHGDCVLGPSHRQRFN